MFDQFNIWRVHQNDSKYLNAVGTVKCMLVFTWGQSDIKYTVLYDEFGNTIFTITATISRGQIGFLWNQTATKENARFVNGLNQAVYL